MDETKPIEHKKRSRAFRIARVVLRIVLIFILLVSLLALSILTPPVQNFIRGKAVSWLSDKLNTRVAINKIYLGFPKKVVLEGVYLEDKQKDTLLYGGNLEVDISMLKLLHSEVEVSQVSVSDLTAKVRRVLPDTIYNFQFIINAFASKEPTTPSADTSSMKISVRGINLDRIRLIYKDDVTGNDVAFGLKHFDTEFDEFDLDRMKFSLPQTNISGVYARVSQHRPLQVPSIVPDTASSSPLPDFGFNKINLQDVDLEYGDDASALFTKLALGNFSVDADRIDLPHQTITLNDLSLKNLQAAVRMGKLAKADSSSTQIDTASSSSTPGWRVLVKNIAMDNNHIVYDNDNQTPIKKGMDYMHLGIDSLTLHASNLLYTADTMSASITRGSMKEKTGFRLNTLQTDFIYASTGASLHNLLIETPGTTLRRSADISYTSLDAVQKDVGQLKLDVDLTDSKVQVKDILTFAPFLATQPALSDPNATWLVDGNITGRVSDMNIRRLRLKAFSNTSLDMRGTIAGLPDAKKVKGNLVINSFNTSRRDIELLAPKGSIPSGISIPTTLGLRGTLSGSMDDATADLDLQSSSGGASVKGHVAHPTDSLKADYNVTLVARALNLGTILKNDTLYGPLTATLTATGKGYAQKTANAKITGLISSATLNRYTYKNVRLNGNLASQVADFGLVMSDPNISLDVKGKADLSKSSPSIAVQASIDSLKTFPLHFTSDTIEYRGAITADFPVTDLKNLDGRLLVTQSKLLMQGQQYAIDTLALDAGKSDSGQYLRMNAGPVQLGLTGRYNLVQLGSVFQQAIQPYYAIVPPSTKTDTLDEYDFYLTGQVIDGPLLKAFVPTLTKIEPVSLNGHFKSGDGFTTSLTAPLISMGTNQITGFAMNASTAQGAINLQTDLAQFSSGSSLNVYATRLKAQIADNKINFLLNLKDAENKDKYRIGGIFDQPQTGVYALGLNPDSLMLNYDKWLIAAANKIKLDSGDIHISDFSISHSGQVLSLNSTVEERNAPLEVKFENFRIGTLTAFAKQDSLLADGTINGQVLIKNMLQQPVFTSDLNIANLTFQKDTVGNLAMKVNNTVENTFNADIALTGNGNEVLINGNYYVKPANQSVIDLKLDIRKLLMSSVESFSFGSITKSTGYIDGKFDIAGTFDKPDVEGQLNFNKAGFSPSALGSFFTIDQQAIKVNDEGIAFNKFTIKDSSNNSMVLDGHAYTTNFMNYKFDMGLTATNFEALNSAKAKSKLYYGKFYFDTDLNIRGTESAPVVDGNLTINENTDLTIVMPQDEPGVQDREGVVRFIDVDSLKSDTTILLAKDSVGQTGMTGMDLSVNIEVRKEAQLTLIVDEANGDFLKMQGSAQLTGGIDPSGKTTLTGTYEIDKGQYNLSFNLVKREFEIKKGSKITWLGEPTKANVELTAIYVANTAPQTLVDNMQSTEAGDTYKQKLPFQVNLILGGELLKPDISFDVTLPTDENFNVSSALIDNVQGRLSDLRTQPEQLNKQVFALLLLNRFVAENPFASSGGGGFNAGTAARQSVSKILSDQLNNLASDLIKGVDLNFDLASSEDYTTTEMQNRTDLNVSLSKQLLSDRLKVTIGSNFELEGPQQSNQRSNNLAGNVALDYTLSKDGRYVARAYRKNQYEGELDGYIIETGLTFIIRFDYDQFRELFHSPKQKVRPQRKSDAAEEPVKTGKRKTETVKDSAINE